ncbi:MAG: alpha/beta hydrolase [Acidimicrobiales bacterium]|jgi:pimeloyl-ACP methyl ester carboxylesterase|nr:alpha/beta hydrolase [Acidimicrobiales bacterium]
MTHELTRTYEVEGFSLAWDEWGSGDGPPLVLVHGFSGSAHDFDLHIDALSADRRVLAIDHRGHGRSSNSLDEETYTVDHIVDDVIDWLSHTVDAPIDLLGHSMGGRVALRFALARRDLLNSMILMDTTAWSFGIEDPEVAEMITGFFGSITLDTPMGQVPESPETPLIAAATPGDWQARKDELSAAFDPMACKALGLALFGDRLEQVDHRLGDIDAPVTVIAGEHDHPYVDHAHALADGVANGQAVIIEGAYHSPQLTHQSDWLTAVQSHLTRVA